jgi:hypothetical protein
MAIKTPIFYLALKYKNFNFITCEGRMMLLVSCRGPKTKVECQPVFHRHRRLSSCQRSQKRCRESETMTFPG